MTCQTQNITFCQVSKTICKMLSDFNLSTNKINLTSSVALKNYAMLVLWADMLMQLVFVLTNGLEQYISLQYETHH